MVTALVAQLVERQSHNLNTTRQLKVLGSIPNEGIYFYLLAVHFFVFCILGISGVTYMTSRVHMPL